MQVGKCYHCRLQYIGMHFHGDIMAADYFMTADLLKSRKVYRPVSEIHGVLCGQICAEADKYDVNLSLEILELPSDVEDVVTNLFKMLAEDIRSQLQSEDFSFQPLLPDDDESFEHRLQALSSWCDGFNAGFAGAWVKEDGDMSTEVREVLSDFSRIAEVDEEDSESSDSENEANFMEISEYVRMATITVYMQMNQLDGAVMAPDSATAEDNIH